ncbi:MAG: formylmethanofuran--tetrahydromethanopterin N-formyltransferase [Hyphomicrobiales bacterium]|nr:formylmethanofuran--tetrahydromethanopterin N-formyltransferase [Hyphomicrobiales bacterium]
MRIDDTFAEAFGMAATAVVITAPTAKWAMIAAQTMTGFATSVIGCGCEAGIDRELAPDETPDGRPGVRALLFAFSPDGVEEIIVNRVGQCVLTCPGTACYSGLDTAERIKLGSNLRYFGDGFQMSKQVDGKRYWRVPVMEGEFVCEENTGVTTEAVGGGNLLIMGQTAAETLAAAETAVAAMSKIPDCILPFPGGIVRSGSKVGSRYTFMRASTNEAYCPTLRGAVETALDPDIGSVQEIVIDGLTSAAVANCMKAGLKALIDAGPKGGVLRVGAGNYGGKLGQHHYHLKDLLP